MPEIFKNPIRTEWDVCDSNADNTDEWGGKKANVYYNCKNNCKYCYVRLFNIVRFSKTTAEGFSKMTLRDGILEHKFRKSKKIFFFPTAHDIIGDPEITKNCIKVLKNILIPGNRVLIVSKPNMYSIKEICNELKKFKKNILFRFTITTFNKDLLNFWEYNAPKFQERLRCLKYAHNLGFNTSVSIEPYLDYDPIPLIEKIYDFINETIWIGKMKYIPRKRIPKNEIKDFQEIRKNYTKDNIKTIYNNTKDLEKIRYKKSIRKVITKIL